MKRMGGLGHQEEEEGKAAVMPPRAARVPRDELGEKTKPWQ